MIGVRLSPHSLPRTQVLLSLTISLSKQSRLRLRKVVKLDWLKDGSNAKGPKKKELGDWCRERIGTVHTFQGKEEDSVLMVLGADWQHEGSVAWACAKPNILNVALTRARRRFYVVGDRALWGNRGPLAGSMNRLPTLEAREFLAIAQNTSTLAKPASS